MYYKDKLRIYKSFDEIHSFNPDTILHIIHNDEFKMFELIEFLQNIQSDNAIFYNTHYDPKSDLKIIAISKE